MHDGNDPSSWNVLDYTAQVPSGGYRWTWAVDRREGKETGLWEAVADDDPLLHRGGVIRRLLIPKTPLRPSEREYRPLQEHWDLHRLLALTEVSEAGILHFADRYGTLGLQNQEVDVSRIMGLDDFCVFSADSFRDWEIEIGAMREALEQLKRWKAQHSDADLEGIRTALGPRLQLIGATLTLNPTGPGFRMRVEPRNICAAAWLQFVRETESFFDVLQCPECGGWFKYFPDQIKTPRSFCSQGCRSKAYRRRQREALTLNAQGFTAEEIAKRVGSDVPTVAGWISRRQSSEKAGNR